jgi:hypothetical protein
VLESTTATTTSSSSGGGGAGDDCGTAVFDSVGVALCGWVQARFRFSFWVQSDDGSVMIQAQERITTPCPCLAPPKETLENEHRHTFQELNKSFLHTQHE